MEHIREWNEIIGDGVFRYSSILYACSRCENLFNVLDPIYLQDLSNEQYLNHHEEMKEQLIASYFFPREVF